GTSSKVDGFQSSKSSQKSDIVTSATTVGTSSKVDGFQSSKSSQKSDIVTSATT
ncbi:Uncharacterized protein DAT39_013591, partial [Clarias magur]